MSSIPALFLQTANQVWVTFTHNWYFLVLGAVVAAVLELYVSKDRIAGVLHRNRRGSVVAATAVAVATPLCSCGTTAVILGMLASTLPWAPIVAFMVASPLTSPTELFYSAGLFGWPFALTFFGASIVLGLGGGFAAMALEGAGLLPNQARLAPASAVPGVSVSSAPAPSEEKPAPRPRQLAQEAWKELRRLLLFFFGFAFIGYFLNALIPTEWVVSLFGPGKLWAVPLAATLGLPAYVSTEASLPMVRAFMDNGASAGATLAFLITGAGTSIGALAGALTIARWRVVGLVVATLWIGATVIGLGYDALV